MAKRMTQESFIERLIDTYGSRYDFSMTVYNGDKESVSYRCKACDRINTVKGYTLLRGNHCIKCSRKTIARAKTKDKSHFIRKARAVHGDRYDYSLVDYKRTDAKVKIVCPDHGVFEKEPSNHYFGQGCHKCSHWDILAKYRPNDDAILYCVCFKPLDGSKPFLKIGITTKPEWKHRFYGAKNLGFDVMLVKQWKGKCWKAELKERFITDYLDSIGDRYKYHALKGTHLGGWSECFSLWNYKGYVEECMDLDS